LEKPLLKKCNYKRTLQNPGLEEILIERGASQDLRPASLQQACGSSIRLDSKKTLLAELASFYLEHLLIAVRALLISSHRNVGYGRNM
jgi:hypothetical protein